MKECQGYIEGYSAEESFIYLQERASELGVDISGCTLDNITPIADKCTPTRVRKAWKIARKDKYTKPNCIYCLDCGLVGYDVFTLHKKPITDNAPARFLMLHTVVERSKTGHEKVIASFPKKLPAERLAAGHGRLRRRRDVVPDWPFGALDRERERTGGRSGLHARRVEPDAGSALRLYPVRRSGAGHRRCGRRVAPSWILAKISPPDWRGRVGQGGSVRPAFFSGEPLFILE